MENRNIILILLVIIVVLAVIAGVMFLKHSEGNKTGTETGSNNTTASNETVKINETKTESIAEEKNMDFPKYSPTFGNYRTVESEQESAVIETSEGEYYVITGDGYYTYAGHDSQGNIKLGSYVGKYRMR